MVRNIFGWSLPPGVTTLPGEDEPPDYECEHCGSILPDKPDEEEPWEDEIGGDIIAAGVTLIWKCKECGKITKTSI